MLRARGVTKTFGGLTALDTVDLEVDTREIVGLIGPNGAGKTTFFNVITGVYPASAGTIEFDGAGLVGRKPHEVAKLGIHRTFQTARTFNESTVLENATIGAVFGSSEPPALAEGRERAHESLAFVGLDDVADERAGRLTLADRKLLELAKGLAAQPSLLLIDEIGAGLTATELDEVTATLERVRDDQGIGILWIEHVMAAIMRATDRIVVLNQGQKIADGPPAAIRDDERVAEAYLGGVEL